MNLVRRCKDGDLCTGNEATVKSIVLSGDIRKIEVSLFLFNHEGFVIIFMSFHHKLSVVKFIHVKAANVYCCILVFWIVLIKLLFLHVFLYIVKESFHSLSEDQKIFPY